MLDRRRWLRALVATGIGSAVFHRSLVAAAMREHEFTIASLKEAEWITDLELTDDQRTEILQSVQQANQELAELRKVKLDYRVPMAIQFFPAANRPQIPRPERFAQPHEAFVGDVPDSDEAIAFLSVHQLAGLIQSKKVSSLRLTNIYLARLKKYAPMLRSVVTLTEASAIEQATKADQEIAAGEYRGVLHGIPWGAKDLIAISGYPTTWGIPHYEHRELDHTATVAQRLAQAGAVLVAKLSLGALAQGDKWFGKMTRNPWNPVQGSSGSSAGSAASVIAGLVGFTLGSETLGSILSPSIRCGVSSLRPTFGRVSRDGCMPLSWSLDKIGPLCRSVEDCALVFDAIHGADGRDPTAGSFPFTWPSQQDLSTIRVGYAKSQRRPDDKREELRILKELGCELVEVALPTEIPLRPLLNIIDIEAASVFDDLLRAGQTEGWNSWTNSFRTAQYISAVDYVKIQRARSLLIRQYADAIKDVDVIVNMGDLIHSNFTGHPSVVLPIAYRELANGGRAPVPVVLTGQLNDDERLLAFARAFQSQTTAHQQHPSLDDWLARFEAGTLDEEVKEPPKEKPP